jgi:hypothetical protein
MMWILTSVRHRALAGMVLGAAPCLLGLAAAIALWAGMGTGAAAAASHVLRAKAKVVAPDAGKPQLVGTFGDWLAYQAQSPKSKICYALAQPKDRAPATLKSAQAYIFISSRPGEHVRNEISVIMGVPLKEGSGDAKAEVGTTGFDLVTKGQNAWMKNAAQESQLIEVMKKHGRLMVKAPVVKGGTAIDSYSLSGLAQALDRVAKDCP